MRNKESCLLDGFDLLAELTLEECATCLASRSQQNEDIQLELDCGACLIPHSHPSKGSYDFKFGRLWRLYAENTHFFMCRRCLDASYKWQDDMYIWLVHRVVTQSLYKDNKDKCGISWCRNKLKKSPGRLLQTPPPELGMFFCSGHLTEIIEFAQTSPGAALVFRRHVAGGGKICSRWNAWERTEKESSAINIQHRKTPVPAPWKI